jgi:hypothetical protein
MLIGAAVFSRPLVPASLIAAFAGGLAPDLPMLGMVLWTTRIAGFPEHEVFGELYFSEGWQAVFAVDHSLLLWSILFSAALGLGSVILRAFFGSGLLHAMADFLTHHDDARQQLWPLSEWVFRSPVSYWDSRYFGDVFGLFELGLVIILTIYLIRQMQFWWQRAMVLAVSAILVLPFALTGSLHGLHGMG